MLKGTLFITFESCIHSFTSVVNFGTKKLTTLFNKDIIIHNVSLYIIYYFTLFVNPPANSNKNRESSVFSDDILIRIIGALRQMQAG